MHGRCSQQESATNFIMMVRKLSRSMSPACVVAVGTKRVSDFAIWFCFLHVLSPAASLLVHVCCSFTCSFAHCSTCSFPHNPTCSFKEISTQLDMQLCTSLYKVSACDPTMSRSALLFPCLLTCPAALYACIAVLTRLRVYVFHMT